MKLYLSSNVIVENSDMLHSCKYLDFGRGVYLTSLYDQAIRICWILSHNAEMGKM